MTITGETVYDYLDGIAPFGTAEPWDNPGLLVGDPAGEVTGILTALDATHAVLAQAEQQGINLIVTHHPVIFDPVKQLLAGTIAYEAARRGIAILCAHTNLDKADWGVNQVLAELLGLTNIQPLMRDQLGRVGTLATPLTPAQFAKQIEQTLGLQPRYNPAGKERIHMVGLCGGSGGDLVAAAREEQGWDYQAFVTGDVKQDEYLEAARLGITLYDAGHWATEAPIIPVLTRRLGETFPGLRIAQATGYTGQIME